jgi:hypothetical protein
MIITTVVITTIINIFLIFLIIGTKKRPLAGLLTINLDGFEAPFFVIS